MGSLLFTLYAIAACSAAVGVVLSQNVVRMAFWLVISLSCVAGLFFMLDADFVGATQLLIYVGGTVVLLIFGVMLTSSGPYLTIKSNPAEVIQASVVGVAFLGVLLSTVTSVDWESNRLTLKQAGVTSRRGSYYQQGEGNTSRHIGGALLGVRFDHLGESASAADHAHDATAHDHVHDVADHTHGTGDHAHASHDHVHGGIAAASSKPETGSGYLLPFEIVSVHLLVVLIGAAYLARAKRRLEPVA
ncbi:MAG: NADH-quinone oxidoreductase subunit J [Planctomycetaceae bacterium]|nr:NADH-quinone oxidoreductase subunit J [Planctomycetaceae bacterium]